MAAGETGGAVRRIRSKRNEMTMPYNQTPFERDAKLISDALTQERKVSQARRDDLLAAHDELMILKRKNDWLIERIAEFIDNSDLDPTNRRILTEILKEAGR